VQELSLHILDLLQNSLAAGATKITLMIKDDPEEDELTLVVADNGCGMTGEQCSAATSPFFTNRNTRRVGFGLSFLEMATAQCGGSLRIASDPGFGTEVMATFCRSHPDRQPLGNMGGTIVSALLGESGLTFEYLHIYKRRTIKISSSHFTELSGVPFQFDNPVHLKKLESYIKEQLQTLYGGESL